MSGDLTINHGDGQGSLYAGSLAGLYTDGEGGNLDLKSPEKTLGAQMDLYNNKNLRLYVYDVNPWKYVSDFGYVYAKDMWWANGGFTSPVLYEANVPLSDKYNRKSHHIQQRWPPTQANWGHMWAIRYLEEADLINGVVIVVATFLHVPANGYVDYYLAVGAPYRNTYLSKDFNSADYRYRTKGRMTNNAGVENAVSVVLSIYVGNAAIHDCIYFETYPSYAYGNDTDASFIDASVRIIV